MFCLTVKLRASKRRSPVLFQNYDGAESQCVLHMCVVAEFDAVHNDQDVRICWLASFPFASHFFFELVFLLLCIDTFLLLGALGFRFSCYLRRVERTRT